MRRGSISTTCCAFAGTAGATGPGVAARGAAQAPARAQRGTKRGRCMGLTTPDPGESSAAGASARDDLDLDLPLPRAIELTEEDCLPGAEDGFGVVDDDRGRGADEARLDVGVRVAL